MAYQFSPEELTWIQAHRQAHSINKRFTGKNVARYVDEIDEFMMMNDAHTILDYGCGKALYWPTHWLNKIQGYDPCYEPFAGDPLPADCVVCCDVMEHVPESAVTSTLTRITELAGCCVFLSIAVRPAGKQLPNGHNAHRCVKPSEWWDHKLTTIMTVPHRVHYT